MFYCEEWALKSADWLHDLKLVGRNLVLMLVLFRKSVSRTTSHITPLPYNHNGSVLQH
jgi:hypothetical protein